MTDTQQGTGGWPFVELTSKEVVWWTSDQIIRGTLTGDFSTDWATEISGLWSRDRDQMVALVSDINSRGIVHPVRIAYEGPTPLRVVDGHHRIAACHALVRPVPCVIMDHSEEQ